VILGPEQDVTFKLEENHVFSIHLHFCVTCKDGGYLGFTLFVVIVVIVVTLPLSRGYLLCYLIQDDQTWRGSTSRHGAVL